MICWHNIAWIVWKISHYLFSDGLEAIEPDQTHAVHYNQDSIRNINICNTITKYLEKGKEKYSIKEEIIERMQNVEITYLIMQSISFLTLTKTYDQCFSLRRFL